MSRTNLDVDDEAIAIIMRRYGVTTKTDAVALALRHLAGQPLTVPEALALQGANLIGELPTDTGP